MSAQPPPPPTSPPPPPPPPPGGTPQPGWGASPAGWGSAPPGYVNYQSGQVGTVVPSAGLSKAMIAIYAVATAAAGLLAVAFFLRSREWDNFVGGTATLDDLDRSDNLVGGIAVLQIALVIVGAIVTSIWSRRIAQNAQARGVWNAKPGMAAGGWFIPIGWFWLGFKELRKSGEGVRAPIGDLAKWQAFFVIQSVSGIFARNLGSFDQSNSASEVTDALRNQWMVGAVSFALYVGATIFAARAAKTLNTAVSGG